MKTYLDCIPCFFKQALEAARISGADARIQKEVLDRLAEALPAFSLDASPPEMGRIIYGMIRKCVGKEDPYLQIKDQSNAFALRLLNPLKHKLSQSRNSLLRAVEVAIAGNIIDYGVKNTLDVDAELAKIVSSDQDVSRNGDGRFFRYEDFEEGLKKVKRILYLADNAGETVFDRLLLEEIKRRDPKKDLLYAVKEKPIINDALKKDAIDCGIDGVATILTSGSDAPGTILPLCSDEFLDVYEKADMVISKGQGNFEGLSQTKRPVFFLLLAKCPVIARDIGCRVGDMILLNHHGCG